MRAQLQALSPLVPIREINFLRFSKKLAEGVWVVVDVSVDEFIHGRDPSDDQQDSFMSCRKLPSGCVIQEFSNGQSKVYLDRSSIYISLYIYTLVRMTIKDHVRENINR